MQVKERILKAAKEKGQIIYKGRPIRITPDFSLKTMKSQKVMVKCDIDIERPWMPAQTTIPRKTFNQHRRTKQDIL